MKKESSSTSTSVSLALLLCLGGGGGGGGNGSGLRTTEAFVAGPQNGARLAPGGSCLTRSVVRRNRYVGPATARRITGASSPYLSFTTDRRTSVSGVDGDGEASVASVEEEGVMVLEPKEEDQKGEKDVPQLFTKLYSVEQDGSVSLTELFPDEEEGEDSTRHNGEDAEGTTNPVLSRVLERDLADERLLDVKKPSRQQQVPQVQGVPSKTRQEEQEDTAVSAVVVLEDRKVGHMVREITSLGLPALGGLLLDPLMSLMDTACVGQVSSVQLASMAPCTSICQFVFTVFFFLSAATTNMVAANPPDAEGITEKEVERRVEFNERVQSSAVTMAVVLGILVLVGLQKFMDPLLIAAGCSPDLAMLQPARDYLRIRSIGAPLVLVATVLQGASLGRHDAVTPLKIFAVAGLLNLVGDVQLTLFRGWGVVGAAIATVASQAAATIWFLTRSTRLGNGRMKKARQPRRGVALAWKGLPTKKIAKTFGSVAVVLFLRSIGQMLAYSLLTRTAATMGAATLAAHQVTLQVWWMLSFVPEPMSVAAQTLVARDKKVRGDASLPRLITVLYGMAIAAGGIVAALTFLALTVPSIAGGLVADPVVRSMLKTTAPYALVGQLISSVSNISDNVCIGSGDMKHLPVVMVGSTLATIAGLWMVTKRNMGLQGVWLCLNIFHGARVAGHLVLSQRLRQYISNGISSFRRGGKGAAQDDHQVGPIMSDMAPAIPC